MVQEHQPLVSVIVPAYNAEPTLSETLASIAAQTYRNLEIVVVDDGSTDRTFDIASAFAASDSRARVVSIANGGVAIARNTGAASSTGPFIAPIDADDLWHPDYLETLVGVILAAPEPPAYAYAPCRLIDPSSNVICSGLNARSSGKVIYRMLYRNLVGNGSGLVISRTAFDAVGGYDARLHAAGLQGCEDYLLQLMLASHGTVCTTDRFLVGYRQGPNTLSRDVEKMAASQRMARLLHRQAFPDIIAPRWLDRWVKARNLLVGADVEWSSGRKTRAIGQFGAALLADPEATWAAVKGRLRSRVRNLLQPPQATQLTPFTEVDPARKDAGPPAAQPRPGSFVHLQLKRLEFVAHLDGAAH